MHNLIKKYIYFIFSVIVITLSCSPEEAEVSKIQRFKSFGFEGINNKIEVQEPSDPSGATTVIIPFTFNNDQIFDFHIDVHVDANSTAIEDVDFALGSHSIEIATLQKSGEIEFIIGGDLFLEGDESVFLTLTSDHVSGLPVTKTFEIVIKNTGGCPEYIHNDFVGDYEVISDEWADWAAGTTLTLVNEGNNILSFKYNCGDFALPILLNIDPSTFGISGNKQEYCSYDLPPLTKVFGDIVEASSSVNTCDKEITVAITHTTEAGASFGTGAIVLKKK